jgi:hypothetical protein
MNIGYLNFTYSLVDIRKFSSKAKMCSKYIDDTKFCCSVYYFIFFFTCIGANSKLCVCVCIFLKRNNIFIFSEIFSLNSIKKCQGRSRNPIKTCDKKAHDQIYSLFATASSWFVYIVGKKKYIRNRRNKIIKAFMNINQLLFLYTLFI